MRILLYNPDNGVTRNFMPHLWMFLLQSLTPPGHEVLLIDGNARPMNEAQIAQMRRAAAYLKIPIKIYERRFNGKVELS